VAHGRSTAASDGTRVIVAVTRLRLRSLRYLLPFAYHARRSRRQAEIAPGCLGVEVRKTRGLAFWTLTLWDSEQSLKRYLIHEPHRKAMPKLAHWCDEAAVGHWTQDASETPAWDAAAAGLLQHGRLSRVLHPSMLQANGQMNVT
jgi:hypothetical protein